MNLRPVSIFLAGVVAGVTGFWVVTRGLLTPPPSDAEIGRDFSIVVASRSDGRLRLRHLEIERAFRVKELDVPGYRVDIAAIVECTAECVWDSPREHRAMNLRTIPGTNHPPTQIPGGVIYGPYTKVMRPGDQSPFRVSFIYLWANGRWQHVYDQPPELERVHFLKQ